MAVPAGFVQALIDYAEAIDDVTVLEKERDTLYARIKDGEAGALISSSVNGQNFGFSGNTITIEEKFAAFCQAIKEFKDERVTTTFADFSGIQR